MKPYFLGDAVSPLKHFGGGAPRKFSKFHTFRGSKVIKNIINFESLNLITKRRGYFLVIMFRLRC